MKTLLCPLFKQYDGQQAEINALQAALDGYDIQLKLWPVADGELPACDAVYWQTASYYHHRMDAFEALLKSCDVAGVSGINPHATIRWNSDKRYLQQLQKAGVHLVPTHFAPSFNAEKLKQAAAARGWHELVVKPTISAGADFTHRCTADSLHQLTMPTGRAIMLQPFLPQIQHEGEWSLVYIGGKFAHAVLKTAKAGDYRIQHVHGGSYRAETPPSDMRADAEAILNQLPAGQYARIDGVRDANGRFMLMEVEMIEPYLYADAHPNTLELLAKTIASSVNN